MQIAAFQVAWGKSSDFSWKTNQYKENDLVLYGSGGNLVWEAVDASHSQKVVVQQNDDINMEHIC